MKLRRLVVVAVAVVVVAVGAGLWFAPYVYTEMLPRLAKRGLPFAPASMIRDEALPGPAVGAVKDARWRVQMIAPGTYALGEPQGDPDNYEYLLVGTKRALLIDAGRRGGTFIRCWRR